MKERKSAPLLMVLSLAVLLTLVGCGKPAAAPNDPGKAVVSVLFEEGGNRVAWSSVSLGEQRVVTASPWADRGLSFDIVEVHWGEGSSGGEKVAKVEEEWGITLIRTAGSAPAAGSAAQVKQGDQVIVLGRREGPLPPAQSQWRSSLGPLQEVEGWVSALGTSLPDPQSGSVATGPFLEVRAAAHPDMVGGLVLDAERRPVAVIRLVQVASSRHPARLYALPLEEVQSWAAK